jgi:hypothetical protein
MRELIFIVLSIIIFTAGLLVLSSVASASPYLVSDPSTDASVDSCTVTGVGFSLPCVLVAKAIKIDLSALPVGSYSVTATFCAGGIWCSSASSPFVFQRPALAAPTAIKLIAQ